MRKGIDILVFCCLLSSACYSQISSSLGFFENLPQKVYANPALAPTQKINVGLPLLSGTFVEHGNNWFDPNKSLTIDENGTATINTEAILDKIDESAQVRQRQYNELFHVGVFIGEKMNSYLHLRATERVNFGFAIPEDMIKLAFYGNAATEKFDASTADFSSLNLSLIHYREYSLGFGTQINDWLRAGVTVKYLYGMEHVETEMNQLKLRTDPVTYDLSSSGSLDLRTSGIYGLLEDDAESNQENISNYLFGMNNSGLGFDLGVTAQLFDNLEVQVSALDIGWINWRSDIATYSIDDASYLYSGLDLTDILFDEENFDENFESELDSIVDELESRFVPDRETESYSTSLNGVMRYGAAYDFEEFINLKGSAWLSFTHGLETGFSENLLGIGYTHRVGNWLEANINLNGRNMRSFALGAGLVLKGGPVQLYLLVNNYRIGEYTSITVEQDANSNSRFFYPSNPSSLIANFGLNFIVGEKRETSGPRSFMDDE